MGKLIPFPEPESFDRGEPRPEDELAAFFKMLKERLNATTEGDPDEPEDQ